MDSIVQFEDQLGGESSGEDETFLVTDPQAYKSRKSSEASSRRIWKTIDEKIPMKVQWCLDVVDSDLVDFGDLVRVFPQWSFGNSVKCIGEIAS